MATHKMLKPCVYMTSILLGWCYVDPIVCKVLLQKMNYKTTTKFVEQQIMQKVVNF